VKKLELHPFTERKVAEWRALRGKRNQGIHLRVQNGRQVFEKVNTAKNKGTK
jgi:hypothetical protein